MSRTHTLKHTHAYNLPHTHTHTHINTHNRLHLFACAVPLSRSAFPYPLGTLFSLVHFFVRSSVRRTGNRRPISGPESFTPSKRAAHSQSAAAAADRSKRKPPRGMYINHDDLTALAGCKNPCEYLAEGERKIAALMAEVRNVICIFSHHYCVLSYCVVVSFFSPLSRIVRSLPASLRFLCIVLL